MTRDATPYAQQRVFAPAVGQDVSTPVAGFFRHRVRSGAVVQGVEIRFGAPLDPVTGLELDRSPRWMAFVDGEYFDDWNWIWPACCGEPISEQDYHAFIARKKWAEQHAPDSAYATGRRFDPLDSRNPMPF